MRATNQPLISIIVPIYNAQAYVTECVQSLISQTYENIEILLIDDGSTDASASICEQIAKKDTRIRFFSQENKGVSAARNLALYHMRGKYVTFVDSDDYVSKDFVRKLYEAIDGHDISACGYERVCEDMIMGEYIKVIKSVNCENASFTMTRDELYSQILCNNNIGGYLCTKLFKTSIIKEHQMLFDTRLSIGEDMSFIARYCNYAASGNYVNLPLYSYRINPQSALQNMYTTGNFNPKKVSNMDAVVAIDTLTENKTPTIKKAIGYRYVRTCIWLMFNMLVCNYYDKSLLARIKKVLHSNLNLFYYISNKNSKFLEKCCALIITISPTLFFRLASLGLKLLPKSFTDRYLN